jgi:hypothetical protein
MSPSPRRLTVKHGEITFDRPKGNTLYIPAARSRYITLRSTAKTGCTVEAFETPKKRVAAYRAPIMLSTSCTQEEQCRFNDTTINPSKSKSQSMKSSYNVVRPTMVRSVITTPLSSLGRHHHLPLLPSLPLPLFLSPSFPRRQPSLLDLNSA